VLAQPEAFVNDAELMNWFCSCRQWYSVFPRDHCYCSSDNEVSPELYWSAVGCRHLDHCSLVWR